MFCCTLLYVHFSIAIILMGKRELIALLNLSSWCLLMVERLFLAVPRGCLQFVIVVFSDHTHLLFLGPKPNYIVVNTRLKCDFTKGVEHVICDVIVSTSWPRPYCSLYPIRWYNYRPLCFPLRGKPGMISAGFVLVCSWVGNKCTVCSVIW